MEQVENPAGWQSWPRKIRRWWSRLTFWQKLAIVAGALLAGVAIVLYVKSIVVPLTLVAQKVVNSVGTVDCVANEDSTARCNDGWYSSAPNCQGQCSHHGGVEHRLTSCPT